MCEELGTHRVIGEIIQKSKELGSFCARRGEKLEGSGIDGEIGSRTMYTQDFRWVIQSTVDTKPHPHAYLIIQKRPGIGKPKPPSGIIASLIIGPNTTTNADWDISLRVSKSVEESREFNEPASREDKNMVYIQAPLSTMGSQTLTYIQEMVDEAHKAFLSY